MDEDQDIMLGEYREYMMQVLRISMEQASFASSILKRMMKLLSEEEILSGDPADIADVYFKRAGNNPQRITKTPYRRAIRFYQSYRGAVA